MKFKQLIPFSIHELGQRDNQEDSMYPAFSTATQEDRLFIICDGMGGHENGEVASNAVCTAMAEYVKNNTNPDEPFTDEQFQEALKKGFEALDNAQVGGAKSPGTTLTFLYFHKGGTTVAHIGDSRIYHVRPATKEILYKTRDHSVVFDLYLAGEINEEDILTHPQKNIITRAMLKGQEEKPKADIVHISNIKLGDYFYLCTDGMLEQMSDSQLLDILCDSDISDDEKIDTLIRDTQQNRDNHTAYLIKVGPIESEFGDENLVDDEEKAMALIRKRQAMVIAEEVTILEEDTPAVSLEQSQDVVSPVQPQSEAPFAGAVPQDMSNPVGAGSKPLGKKVAGRKAVGSRQKKGLPMLSVILACVVIIAIAAIAFIFLGNNNKKAAPEINIPSQQHRVSAPAEVHSESPRNEVEQSRQIAAPQPSASSERQEPQRQTTTRTTTSPANTTTRPANTDTRDRARVATTRAQQQNQQTVRAGELSTRQSGGGTVSNPTPTTTPPANTTTPGGGSESGGGKTGSRPAGQLQ